MGIPFKKHNRDWIRNRLVSLINGRVGTNVNSLNVGTQKSTEKAGTADVSGLLRRAWSARLLPISVKLPAEVYRVS